jgi:DNA-binding NtrC family response regulator
MLTAFGTVHSAVEAMKEGAYDYLIKPVDNDEFKLVVEKALELHRLQREVARLRSQLQIDLDFQDIVGQSKPMRAVFRLMRMVAKSNATILIQGESGTGKELIARALHQHSERSDGPFVAIDCASLPETLLESELFGHVRGAFTGAINNKKGLFVEAHGGTILLDEIGDITMALQSKLLRIVQENEVRPVGTNKSIKIDVRVIAATNKDLKKEVERKAFREDLFYRLAVVPIHLPPAARAPRRHPAVNRSLHQKIVPREPAARQENFCARHKATHGISMARQRPGAGKPGRQSRPHQFRLRNHARFSVSARARNRQLSRFFAAGGPASAGSGGAAENH